MEEKEMEEFQKEIVETFKQNTVDKFLEAFPSLTIRELVKEAYETAKEKGWHDTERPPMEYHALIHSEISEATEQARLGTLPFFCHDPLKYTFQKGEEWKIKKPEGELIELADAIIRIADYCGSRGWDLEEALRVKMAYNKTRPHRHGGKKY